MTINLLVYGVFLIYGVAAFPKGVYQDVFDYPEDILRGYGNTTTCDIQGFFLHVCYFSALFYYSFFSVYSYAGVLNNFRVYRYGWIEKYIHIVAHLYPVGSGILLLVHQNFNPVTYGICQGPTRWPPVCESPVSGGRPCERGSPGTTHYLVSVLPLVFILVFSTGIMGALYRKVRRNPSGFRIRTRSVAVQAFLYLLMMYLVTVPTVMVRIFVRSWERGDDKTAAPDPSVLLILLNVSLITSQCLGLFILMVYRYFSSGKYWGDEDAILEETNRRKQKTKTKKTVLVSNAVRKPGRTVHNNNNKDDDGDDDDDDNNGGGCGGDFSGETTLTDFHQSFNIFDGTNAGGAFAEFIHDGDSDDEAADEEETERWNGMQGL